jgi:F-type H+-transporting ATPase subunit b
MAAIEREKALADKVCAERASRLAVEIAERLAARLDGPAVRAAFLSWLLREIRALPDSVRQAVAENGVVLKAISATPLAPADEERYRERIGDAWGMFTLTKHAT